MRVLGAALALAICACALPAVAHAATVTIDAVEQPDRVTRADVVDEIPRYRLFFNTRAQLKGVVTRDDGTPAAVAGRFPRVEVLDAGRNLGAAARTLGVRHVDAPYVAFCDDDAWWEPGSLRAAADLFDAQPRLAVISARVLVGPEDREDPACDVLARSPLPREPGMPGPPLLGFLAGASVVRRSAFLDVGGFEPRFFIGGEEEARVSTAGRWTRVTLERGHILTRGPAAVGLTPVRETGAR